MTDGSKKRCKFCNGVGYFTLGKDREIIHCKKCKGMGFIRACSLCLIKNAEALTMNNKKLWAFLEKYTRPLEVEGIPQWKDELDSIFLD